MSYQYHSWFYQAHSIPPPALAPVEPDIAGQEGSEDHPPAHEPQVLSTATVMAIAGSGPLVDIFVSAPAVTGQESSAPFTNPPEEIGIVPPNVFDKTEVNYALFEVLESVAQMMPAQDVSDPFSTPPAEKGLEPPNIFEIVEENPGSFVVPAVITVAQMAPTWDWMPVPTWQPEEIPYYINDVERVFASTFQLDKRTVSGRIIMAFEDGDKIRLRVVRTDGSSHLLTVDEGSSMTGTVYRN